MASNSKSSTARPVLLQGCPESSADLFYRTRFLCSDAVVYLENAPTRYLVVSDMELGRARREAAVDEVLTPHTLGLVQPQAGRIADWALAVVRHAGIRSVGVPASFPLGSARWLEAHDIELQLLEAPVFPGRQVKDAPERSAIARAQSVAVRAMRAAMERIHAADIDVQGRLCDAGGVLTSASIRCLIQQTALRYGAIAQDTIVACGRDGADPHARGQGPLRAGRPIVIDIFPRMQATRYWGDLTRTLLKGHATPVLKAWYGAVLAAQRAALGCVRSGVSCGRVHRAANDELQRQGFDTGRRNGRPFGFIHSTGHGVGLDIHEWPRLAPGSGARLRAGQVVTVEPGWYDPAIGGIRIEDTVVVTKTGFEFLARCPYRFEW